ncbi:MAG: RidA family protein [Candidatus Dojkabacteria bacterium]|nr:RidA family protein [Candidatus Dojkabacteria bacterium]
MKIINTPKAPTPVGPYSQAIVVDNFIFCSGQIGLDPNTNRLVEGLENQFHQIMQNIRSILEEAGTSLDKVVKVTIFITDISKFSMVNELYSQYFSDHKPARSTVEVSNLPKNALIEIEVLAVIN